jgi:acetoin utilization deacetylase AcuC-like enzyme
MPTYVTSPRYEVDIGAHVFPTSKYRLVVDRLMSEDGAGAADFIEPEPAEGEDIVRVHDRGYYERCRDGRLSMIEIMQLELPWSGALFDASARCVQGSILAAELALEHGAGLHIGGGFHHAFPGHGEGFCVFNDHAVAIRKMQSQGKIRRALVADCDLHQGNGTAAIFAGDDNVATYSIHQQDIYPAEKPSSTVDVGLPAGAGDAVYLSRLEETLVPLVEDHRPDLIVYVAGADPYEDDQLGSLGITQEALTRRDEIVAATCRRLDVPIMVVLAGGYARRVADTVSIHLSSVRAARALWR